MTKDKDEKAVIRARMERTGESYAAARAQLSREAETQPPDDAGKGGPDRVVFSMALETPEAEGTAAGPSLMTSAASAVVTAARGQTAWGLVLELRRSQGVAAAVLTSLGVPSDLTAPQPAEPARSLPYAMLAAAKRRGDKQVDTGLLLRGAVEVTEDAEVPHDQRAHLARLRDADLSGLCDAARRLLTASNDDRSEDRREEAEGIAFNRFTDRARVVLVKAQEAARDLQHGYIGTEHLLQGMLAEGDGVAAVALAGLGVTKGQVRTFLVEAIGVGGAPVVEEHIPFTPRSKKVLELALRAALELGHNYIGTEHLLIALSREGEGVAAQLLAQSGADREVVRERVLTTLAELAKPADGPGE